jgi:hypothetical protein
MRNAKRGRGLRGSCVGFLREKSIAESEIQDGQYPDHGPNRLVRNGITRHVKQNAHEDKNYRCCDRQERHLSCTKLQCIRVLDTGERHRRDEDQARQAK